MSEENKDLWEKHPKIYVVGVYTHDGLELDAVFSTKEKAISYQEHEGGDILEYLLDPKHSNKLRFNYDYIEHKEIKKQLQENKQ